MDNSFVMLMDIFPTLVLLIYGYKFRFKTPAFGDANGLGSKYTKQSKEAWDYGHKFAGLLALVYGGISAAALAVKYIVFGLEPPVNLDLIIISVNLLFIFLLIPIMNLRVKQLFGEPKDDKKKKK